MATPHLPAYPGRYTNSVSSFHCHVTQGWAETCEEHGTLTQGSALFSLGSSRLGIEPKTPGKSGVEIRPTNQIFRKLLAGLFCMRNFAWVRTDFPQFFRVRRRRGAGRCDREVERERDLYWINSGESPLASVAAGGLAMLLLPVEQKCEGRPRTTGKGEQKGY